MKYLSEKEAENFLEKEGFDIAKRSYTEKESSLNSAISKIGGPFVMKVSGKKIVHKNKLGGIKLNIKTYSEAIEDFKTLKKIKGAKGVLIQEKVEGKEFLIGIKKTPEFGQVIVFGSGGTNTEEKKDVAFRVYPLNREEIRKMIKDTECSFGLLRKDGLAIEQTIEKVNELIKKYPTISELDINPLKVKHGKVKVVDARIVFD